MFALIITKTVIVDEDFNIEMLTYAKKRTYFVNVFFSSFGFVLIINASAKLMPYSPNAYTLQVIPQS